MKLASHVITCSNQERTPAAVSVAHVPCHHGGRPAQLPQLRVRESSAGANESSASSNSSSASASPNGTGAEQPDQAQFPSDQRRLSDTETVGYASARGWVDKLAGQLEGWHLAVFAVADGTETEH